MLILFLVATLTLVAGCERPQTEQWGYKGTGMILVDKPGRLRDMTDDQGVPPPEPRDPPDPEIPLAKDVNLNVQVLTDLDALEFARLMQALSNWVAPEQGCEYCHNTNNLASDEKYTKVVARSMLQMTRDINTRWKSHVANTGVTCWTCHRGKPVPSGIWFTDPGPKTPSAGVTGIKAGQNTAGVQAIGNAALPFDPMTHFLYQDAQASVQGTTALPSTNTTSIKNAEWTYALMMYISNSLGVNCTFCHQTRAMGIWEQSTPQRVTAWHGIRMVRELNNHYLTPLKTLYPDERLGPTGDAPKAACQTCHKGLSKPLHGLSMLGDYPELAGYRTERPMPQPEPAVEVVAQVETPTETVDTTPTPEPTADESAEPVIAESAPEAPESEATPSVAETSAPADADLAESRARIAELEQTVTELRDEAAMIAGERDRLRTLMTEPTDEASSAAVAATEDATETPSHEDQVRERIASARSETERLATDLAELRVLLAETTVDAPILVEVRTALDRMDQRLDAAGARLDQEREALIQQLQVVRAQRQEATAESEREIARLQEAKAAAARTAEVRQGQERTALQQQLEVVRDQRDQAEDAAEQEVARLLEAQAAAARTAEVRQGQERVALQQQLEVVRDQRDRAEDAAELEVARLLEAQAAAARTAEVRQGQERIALQQQLEVVRDQRDRAVSTAEAENARLLEAQAAAVRTAEVRQGQERTALQQQLEVVRDQRDRAVSTAAAEIARLLEAQAAAARTAEVRQGQERTALQQQLAVVRAQREEARVAAEREIERLIAEHEADLRAANAWQDQERLALQQQLAVVRAQRESMKSEKTRAIEQLMAEHEAALRAANAWQDQERQALQQQLAVVRAQRDAAMAETETRLAELTERLAATERDERPAEVAAEAAEAPSAPDTPSEPAEPASLSDALAEIGGEATDTGVRVNLGGDELQFASGSAALPARELPTLERVAQLLAERPDLKARVEGHTDSSGSPQLNQRLSEQRAEAVMRALVARGIDAERVSSLGLGPDRPIADNTTDRGRRENRRVEIYVIE